MTQIMQPDRRQSILAKLTAAPGQLTDEPP
jgi:hypothetical protein